MQLVNTYTKLCCKDVKKIEAIFLLHHFCTHEKKNYLNICKHVKTSTLIFALCKNFHKFFGTSVEKIKENLAN